MTPATIELHMRLRNIAVSAALEPDPSKRTEFVQLWLKAREEARTYAVLDCADELARFMTFEDALAFWKVAPRRYGRNSVVWICNTDRCDGGNPGLTEDELDELENAQDERGAR